MRIEFKWPQGGQNYLPYDLVMQGLVRMFNEKMPEAKFARLNESRHIESELLEISIVIDSSIGRGTFFAHALSMEGLEFLNNNREKFESCLH